MGRWGCGPRVAMQDGGHLGYGPKVGHGSNQLFGQLGFQQVGHLGRHSLIIQHHLVDCITWYQIFCANQDFYLQVAMPTLENTTVRNSLKQKPPNELSHIQLVQQLDFRALAPTKKPKAIITLKRSSGLSFEHKYSARARRIFILAACPPETTFI